MITQTRRTTAASFAGTLILVMCVGCRSEAPNVPASSRARVFGHIEEQAPGVMIADTVSPCEGAKIWVDGRSDTVRSDALGNWEISGVPMGTYTILVQKDGYSYTKFYGTPVMGPECGMPSVLLVRRDTQPILMDSMYLDQASFLHLFVSRHDPQGQAIDQHAVVIALDRNKTRLESNFDSAERYYYAGGINTDPSGLKEAGAPLWAISREYFPIKISRGETVYGRLAEDWPYRGIFDEVKYAWEYPAHGAPSNVFPILIQ